MVESDLTFIGHGNGHLVSHILQADDIVIKINADTCLIKSRGYVGSGKSTLLKLLMGYDDRYEGAIYINNIEARNLDLEIRKTIFSYLPQEERFLNETIEDNIDKMVDADLDGSKMHANMRYYAAMAEVDKEIQGFANSYQTVMENGGQNISTYSPLDTILPFSMMMMESNLLKTAS